MQELIDHSLNVARVASGVEARRERVHLKSMIEDAQMVASSEAAEKQVTLKHRVEDAEVSLDLRLIRSALNNLVRNAVKYSVIGGTVELRARVVNSTITFEVEDSCGGLPKGKVEEAFAPFVRMNKSETGFGLGLAISKQAADAHGGAIRVQNLPGRGCIFVLELPFDAG